MRLLLVICVASSIFSIEGFSHHRFSADLTSSSRFQLHAKIPSYQEQQDLAARVQKYVTMREIQKMKERGASPDDIAAAVKNGTFLGVASAITNKKGYQKFLGKGSLDQRLRAVVAYKRSTIAADLGTGESELTPTEQRELDAMMDNDDGDGEGVPEDDEEELYESLVLKIIEENKLNDLKRNFLLDKDAQREAIDEEKSKIASAALQDEEKSGNETISSDTSALASASAIESEIMLASNETLITENAPFNETSAENATAVDLDLYTPKSSAWGLFQRPRDISKSFGGGRVITRAEMDRMDDEYNTRMQSGQKAQKIFINEIAKIEDENMDKIKDAVSRSRNLMGMGNRQKAVEVLELVQPLISWHSELGGETYLELAMALETVERTDEAREIYGKLVTINWSQKTRRNALQLLQGLDITLKIKQQGFRPMSDAQAAAQSAAMSSIQEALKPGLRNAWNEYKKGDATPWFDDGGKEIASIRIDTFKDAYYLLERVFSPLQKIPSQLINRAFRKMYLSLDTDKLELLKEKGLLDPDKKKRRVTTVSDAVDPFIPGLNSRNEDPFSKKDPNAGSLDTVPMPPIVADLKPLPEASSVWGGANRNTAVMEVFKRSVNGTWDLVAHLTDTTPYTATRYVSDVSE